MEKVVKEFLMKKYTLVFALLAVLPVVAANCTEYETVTDEYYTERPVNPNSYKKTTTNRKTGGYNNTITNNFYYGQPTQTGSYAVTTPKRRVVKPAPVKTCGDPMPVKTCVEPAPVVTSCAEPEPVVTTCPAQERRTVAKETYTVQERKYYLAHPFFQPLKGHFGSVTDVFYAKNNFNFDVLNGTVFDLNTNPATVLSRGPVNPILRGKAETTQFGVKEDVSFGISDTLTLILMAQYDKTKVSFKDWSDGTKGDSVSDSGLNLFGIGLQGRFLDNSEWIGMIAGYFQHQRETANSFIGELKVGYKVARNTIYGLGRFGYSDLIDGDTYGAFVKDSTGDYMMLAYQHDVKDIVYVEGGIGVFSVLSRDFTFNGELVYGYYDWHNQLSIKGAFGWQPGDMFALNLYASTSLYDSAKDKKLHYMHYDVNPEGYSTSLAYVTGDYKIKDYDEWKIGVQAILYF